MNYLTTNYKEFIKQKLHEGLANTEINDKTAVEKKDNKQDWYKEMQVEFEKIMKESDEIYNSYWGKLY